MIPVAAAALFDFLKNVEHIIMNVIKLDAYKNKSKPIINVSVLSIMLAFPPYLSVNFIL